MAPKRRYSFMIDADLAAGLKRQKEAYGVAEGETIRRALRAWLEREGALGKAASRRVSPRRKA